MNIEDMSTRERLVVMCRKKELRQKALNLIVAFDYWGRLVGQAISPRFRTIAEQELVQTRIKMREFLEKH